MTDTENGHGHGKEDERYYFPCPLRKNQARIPVTYCKKRCTWNGSDGKRITCRYPQEDQKRK